MYSGENEQNTISTLNAQYAMIQELRKSRDDILFANKMKAPVRRIEKKFRYQILMKIKGDMTEELSDKIFAVSDMKQHKDVGVFVERNPQNMT